MTPSDPATTLRDALAAMLIGSEMLPDWHDDDVFIAREVVSAILGVLARPEHRAAVLALCGDVREVDQCRGGPDAPICGGEHRCDCLNPRPRPVFVVVPCESIRNEGDNHAG